MPHPDLVVVTGAFSYTGKYVARRLLDRGIRVTTLTRRLIPSDEAPTGTTRLTDGSTTTRAASVAGTCPSYGATTAGKDPGWRRRGVSL